MLLALALVGVAVLPSASSARSRSQARYLGAANKGVKQTHKWWNRGRHWYSSVLGGSSVASLWGIVPLFEAFDGLQVAQPSKRHRDQLNRFARGAELYLNPNLRPVPGFGPKPGQREPGKTTWFDDNGWWGLAFLDAYRATGNPRYLYDAEVAQRFISVSGWDDTPGRPGGIWWNTNHSFYAGESLAGGTLLSARLYALTRNQAYLDDALKFIAWGDVWLTDPATGLYARLRKPTTYNITGTASGGTASAPGSAAAAADERALSANPDEAAKLLTESSANRPAGPPSASGPPTWRLGRCRSTSASGWGHNSTSGTRGRCSSSPSSTTTATGTASCSATRGARCTGRATAMVSICAPGTGRRRRGRTPEGQHPAALGQRSALRMDGGARSLAPGRG